MQKLEVGGYLYGAPKAVQEGYTLSYDAAGPVLLVSLRAIETKEVRAIQRGAISFAVFEREGILFLLAKILGAMDWSDAPFHIGIYGDDRQDTLPASIPDGKGWGLTIIGLEAMGGIIKALRLVSLDAKLANEMIRIIKEQQPISQVDYYNKVRAIQREYDCEKMVKEAKVTFKVPSRE